MSLSRDEILPHCAAQCAPVGPIGGTAALSPRNIAWTREFFDAMRPFAAPGAYVNYLGGDEGDEGLKAGCGTKLARLAALRTKFDPANLFRMNQNIAPAATG